MLISMHRGVCASNHLKDADELEWQDPTWEGPVIPEERRWEGGSGTSLSGSRYVRGVGAGKTGSSCHRSEAPGSCSHCPKPHHTGWCWRCFTNL